MRWYVKLMSEEKDCWAVLSTSFCGAEGSRLKKSRCPLQHSIHPFGRIGVLNQLVLSGANNQVDTDRLSLNELFHHHD